MGDIPTILLCAREKRRISKKGILGELIIGSKEPQNVHKRHKSFGGDRLFFQAYAIS